MRYKFNNKFHVLFVYLCLYDLDPDEELFLLFLMVFFILIFHFIKFGYCVLFKLAACIK